MKIMVEQPKLLEILEYLSVDGLFPFSVIVTNSRKITSAQTDKEGAAFRYVTFSPAYFKHVSEKKEAVKIDVEKTKKFANLRKVTDVLTLEYPVPEMENKMKISGGQAHDFIGVTKVDDDETNLGLPFVMKPIDKDDETSHKVPWLNKGQVALDTRFVMSLNSFKDIVSYASAHGTEFFKFHISKDREANIRIGNIHELDDFSIYEPTSKVYNVHGDVEVTITNGIKELAKTAKGDVDVCMRSNMPMWFKETTKDKLFGILLSPYTKKEK